MSTYSSTTRAVLRLHLSDPLFRQSYFLLVSTALSALSGFLFWFAAAHVANAGAVGRAAALTSAVSLLSYLTSFGLPYGILRHGSDDRGLRSIVGFTIPFTIATSVVASVVFAAGARWWARDLQAVLGGVLGVAFFALANASGALLVVLDNLSAARRAAQYAALRGLVVAVGKLALLGLLASAGARGIFGALFTPVIAAVGVFVLVPRLAALASARGCLAWTPELRRYLSFSFRAYPASLLGGAPQFFLPLIVLATAGASRTAYFYVSWSFVSVLLLLPNAVSNVSLSEGSRSEAREVARRARLLALAIAVPVALALWAAASLILRIYGSDYAHGGAPALRLLAASLVPWTFMVVDLSLLRAQDRHVTLTVSTGVFAVATLSFPLLLGFVYGVNGISAGWTIGVTLSAVIVAVLVRARRPRVLRGAVSAGQLEEGAA